jgi:hypothetical protein
MPASEHDGHSMSRFSTICRCCVTEGVPRRSFIVALIVGTILNLINQGDALLGEGHLNFTKLLLTFAVPYCVATYGAVSYSLNAMRKNNEMVPFEKEAACLSSNPSRRNPRSAMSTGSRLGSESTSMSSREN